MSSGGCTVYQNYMDAGVLTCKVEQGPDRMSKLISVDFTPEVLPYVTDVQLSYTTLPKRKHGRYRAREALRS